LGGFNAKEDRRHDRRTLPLDELRRLIEVAHAGTPYREMTGPARALCYRLAVASGLRYSEIGSITPGSFALDGGHPTVTVAAAYTKNGDPATLPLPPDLAADVVHFLVGMPQGEPVFRLPKGGGAEMLRIDLAAAGIPYEDASGRVFDFHSLRCQCATLADLAGASPRIVQRLMRHSSLDMTNRYTRPRTDARPRRGDVRTPQPPPPGVNARVRPRHGYGWTTHQRTPCPLVGTGQDGS
jgi:integrase